MTNLLLLKIIITLNTNWYDSGSSSTLMWPPEANTITYYESGSIYSNRTAVFEFEGKAVTSTISSECIAEVRRAYTWSKPQKVYEPMDYYPRNMTMATNGHMTMVTNGPIPFITQDMTNYIVWKHSVTNKILNHIIDNPLPPLFNKSDKALMEYLETMSNCLYRLTNWSK